MCSIIKKNFKSSLYKYLKHTLSNTMPKGKWHVMNHFIMIITQKNIYKYKHNINESYLRGIIAFLITVYEHDFFSKIMIALGLTHSEKLQAEHYKNFTKTYIIRWIPGMLTSRYIMSRDFIRARPAKNNIVKYNLRYMRSTVLKLYHIPDLLILNSMDGTGSIVAKEAITMKLPAISIISNNNFPAKVAFKYFANVRDFNFIKSFLYILIYAMETGKDLYKMNNYCGYEEKGESKKNLDIKNNKSIIYRNKNILKDDLMYYKQIVLLNLFSKKSLETNKKYRSRNFIMNNLYENLKLNKKKKEKIIAAYKYIKSIFIESKKLNIKFRNKKKKNNLVYAKKSTKMV